MSILEDLSKAKKKAKPYAVVGGREVYDYDSLEKKVEIDQAEAKVGGGQVDLGKMKPTKDGWGIPTWEIVSRQFLKISYLSIVIKRK